jgi:WD40 repeat protein
VRGSIVTIGNAGRTGRLLASGERRSDAIVVTVMADLFVSYSRLDAEFVRALVESIEERGKRVWVDTEGIADGEVFPQAIRTAIERSDSFVFVITPAAVESRYCENEVEYARKLNKRIVPVLRTAVPDPELPPAIRDRSWIPFTERDQFESSLDRLLAALDRDVEHAKEHTRWLVKAIEWDMEKRDGSFLLRGAELKAAEAWLAGVLEGVEPAPTTLQREYLLASREAAARRQRTAVAVSLAVALVSIGLLVFALISRGQVISAQTVAKSRALAADSENQIAVDPELSILLAMHAVRTSPTPDAVFALRAAIDASPLRLTLLRPAQVGCQLQQGSPSIAADPSGPRLAEGVCGGKLIFGRGAGAGRLLVFDTEDGHVQLRLRVGSGPPVVAYSHDGSLLAVASAGGQVHLYDGASGAPRGVLGAAPPQLAAASAGGGPPPAGARVGLATALAFSSDGSRLAVAAQQGRVMVWSLHSHTAIPLDKTVAPSAAVPIDAAAFTLDGRSIAVASFNGVQVYNTQSGMLQRTLPGISQAADLALSRNGRELAVASVAPSLGGEGLVSLWSTRTWRRVAVIAAFPARRVTALAFSPDGASVAIGNADGSAGLWSVQTHQEEVAYLGSNSRVTAAAFTADGQRVVTAAADGTTNAWRAGGPAVASVNAGGDVTDVRLVGSHLIAELAQGVTRSWLMPETRDQTTVRNQTPGLTGGVAAVSSNGAIAIEPFTRARNGIPAEMGVISTTTGRLVDAVAAIPLFDVAGLSPDGSRLIQLGGSSGPGVGPSGGGTDGEVTRVDGSAAVKLHAPPGPPGGVLGCQWVDVVMSTNDARVAGANFCGGVTIWDADTGRVERNFTNPGEISTIAFSPDGRDLAVASLDSTITIWGVLDGRPVQDLNGHTLAVADVAYSPDGRLLASAGLDDTARVWDPSNGRLLRVWNDAAPVTSVAFSGDGGQLVTGDATGTVDVWDACTACGDAKALLAIGRSRVTRQLTALERATFLGGY